MSGYTHAPVLAEMTIEALAVRPGGRYVDGTVGGGGHAEMILKSSEPEGWLGGCDQDGDRYEGRPFRSLWERGGFEIFGDVTRYFGSKSGGGLQSFGRGCRSVDVDF